ncbi:MAG: 6-phosphofructokinase, partial [Clostridia bacterium]|nr:6-phosphofructokinase [Clostridia bacterium]
MKNCLVGQSGGPTAAINASLAGVIKGALKSDKINKIYGMVNGITGIINDNLILLSENFSDETNLKLLIQTPSSYLGSCRYKLDT